MQKNTVIIVLIVALLAGFGIGYWVGGSKASVKMAGKNDSCSHMMADGGMMGHGGMMAHCGNMNMADMMASMNAALKGKTGDAFDQAFLAEMIVHHEGAVEMAELALVNAKHQEIKDLAGAIIAAQNKEIAQMKAWQKAWYNQ